MIGPSLPATATAHFRGAALDPATLTMLYRDTARQVMEVEYSNEPRL